MTSLDKHFTSDPRKTVNDNRTEYGIVKQLDALAGKHPELALHIRILKAQLAEAKRSPDSAALRRVIATNIARLKTALQP